MNFFDLICRCFPFFSPSFLTSCFWVIMIGVRFGISPKKTLVSNFFLEPDLFDTLSSFYIIFSLIRKKGAWESGWAGIYDQFIRSILGYIGLWRDNVADTGTRGEDLVFWAGRRR